MSGKKSAKAAAKFTAYMMKKKKNGKYDEVLKHSLVNSDKGCRDSEFEVEKAWAHLEGAMR